MALPVRVSRSQNLNPLDYMQREVDMLSRLFHMPSLFGSTTMEPGIFSSPYKVDVREDADHLYVDAELPGFKKDEIDVRLENQTLTIIAEKKEEQQPQQAAQQQTDQQKAKGEFLLKERIYQRFERSFTLPESIDEQQVDAKLQDGILTITLNKKQEAKARKITVS